MTTYNGAAVADTTIAFQKGITLQQGRALRDNPIAIAEGAAGAPYAAAGWHPYNGVTVGDGVTGTIYDFAIDGPVASIETPNFVDGYEYMITWDALNQAASNRSVEWYMETSAAWSTPFSISSSFNDALIEVFAPRLVSNTMFFDMDFAAVAGTNGLVTQSSLPNRHSLAMTTAQKVLKARFDAGSSTFSGGSIRMFRRRCYA